MMRDRSTPSSSAALALVWVAGASSQGSVTEGLAGS